MSQSRINFPLRSQILYSSGHIGITIADRIWVTFMLYFYLPPVESGLPELISNKTILGFLTVAGLVTIFGRIIDSIADPLVATWSDRSKSPFGRRKIFLIIGGLPMMLLCVMLFFPITPGVSVINAFYLAIILGSLLFFYTVYVTPWLALIPEVSANDSERINIVTIQAVFSLLGVIVVMIGGYALWGILENQGIAKSTALQLTIIILALIGLIFCYISIIPINEKKYCQSVPSDIGMIESLKLTFSNKAFVLYLFGTICYYFALNTISQTATYYVTVLLKKPESFATMVFASVFGVALLMFPLVNALTRAFSKKIMMITGLAIFAVTNVLLYFLGTKALILPPILQAFSIFGLIGIPVSILLLLPNAIVSDLAEYDGITTGSKREAMYFGAQGLLQKINLGISTMTLTFLFSVFGKDIAKPLGVRLSGPVAGLICIVGIILFSMFPEEKIMNVIEKNRRRS